MPLVTPSNQGILQGDKGEARKGEQACLVKQEKGLFGKSRMRRSTT